MPELHCSRCDEDKAALEKAPLPGEDGTLVLASACADCWQEWAAEEVRTINELRLNFIDPEAQKTLRERMFAFLSLEGSDPGPDDPLCDRGDESS